MTAYDDRTGTLWVGGIAFYTQPGDHGGVFVARKILGQNAFEPSVMAYTIANADKGWMAAGPAPGDPNATNLYIAFNRALVVSTDMGDTWSSPTYWLDPEPGIGHLPRVGPNGELYVAYWDWSPGGVSDKILLRRSFDSGETFDPPLSDPAITIATRMDVWDIQDTGPDPRFPGTFRVWAFNYLAVDQNDGTLYCVYFDSTDIVNGNYNVDLYFTKSTDQGLTWTTPVVINNDAVPPGDQFFPWIEVDQQGNLHMVFLDSSNTIQDDTVVNAMLDAYYSFSSDRGATWQEFRLTTPTSFESDKDGLNRSDQFLGDYLALGRGGSRVYPCYLSTQNGDPDIYTHVVEIEGACCHPDVSCTVTLETSCADVGGSFLGAGTDCQPLGACCLGDASCLVTTQTCCANVGGSFLGARTNCQPFGACCLAPGGCIDTAETCCNDSGGLFHPNQTCPPLPFGCFPRSGPQPGP